MTIALDPKDEVKGQQKAGAPVKKVDCQEKRSTSELSLPDPLLENSEFNLSDERADAEKNESLHQCACSSHDTSGSSPSE